MLLALYLQNYVDIKTDDFSPGIVALLSETKTTNNIQITITVSAKVLPSIWIIVVSTD